MTNFNQQYQKVHTQFNANNIIIHVHATPDVAALLEKAVRHLHMRHYEEALKSLEAVLEADDGIAAAYYYHALALLKGKRPKLAGKSTAGRMDRNLYAATMLDPQQAHYYYLWALLKYDFYLVNGFSVQPPAVNELLDVAGRLTVEPAKCRELLSHTNAPDCPVSKLLYQRL